MTISTSGGLGLLQMVSEPELGGVSAKTLCPKVGGLRSHVGWKGERYIPYKV